MSYQEINDLTEVPEESVRYFYKKKKKMRPHNRVKCHTQKLPLKKKNVFSVSNRNNIKQVIQEWKIC